MTEPTPLKLFNSLTRQTEEFRPVHPGEARVYSCGPTVYNYPHIGNMRAYVFADTLGRALSFKGYKLTHVINITDVGHLTDDADAGEDKMEKMAAEKAQKGEQVTIWDIAEHYKQAYWADVKALNIRQPAQWTIATDFVPQMIEFAKGIADRHCYELPSGLYFDTSTVADYGRLARADEFLTESNVWINRITQAESQHNIPELIIQFQQFLVQASKRKSNPERYLKIARALDNVHDEASFRQSLNEALSVEREGRIEEVEGKRQAADFAIWRNTPTGETRQMEWDSPWGRGAPGWHLECSVMSGEVLGFPFDIHTGGIDHREIHHPNEIAQNQAHNCTNGLDTAENSGARIWMHNNFLVERSGKMSKSSGEFLRVQLLIDKGFHPLAYRMMCLQAHYRSELEFSWEILAAALTRLKRMVMAVAPLTGLVAAPAIRHPRLTELLARFDAAISDDLNTAVALTLLDEAVAIKKVPTEEKRALIEAMDAVLGFDLLTLTRTALRVRPKDAPFEDGAVEELLATRKAARAAQDFAASDAIRDQLVAAGIEVMDGDPLRWDWKPILG